jgi:DNA-binding NarL/FixJ family response regulator
MLESDGGALLDAVSCYRAGPRRRELALACEDAAVALSAEGRRASAAGLGRESLEIYRFLQARWDATRAQTRLRSAGLHPDTPARAGSKTRGSLTPAERRVAALVAAGLSNPEIAESLGVSPRTVQSHVSKALQKLELTSRVELALVARMDSRKPV